VSASLCSIPDPQRADFHGPDGDPPLGFILDTADVVGSTAIPLGILLLGAGFARMEIPRPLSRLPWVAMISTALCKMVILPVIGVVMVQGFVQHGFVQSDEKVLRFVLMFLSGTPSALNQLVLTQLFCGDNDVDTLCAFLLLQ
jgi:predicted permease